MLLSFLTVVSMDICEEQVVIARGLCLLSEEGKLVKRKYWILHVPYAVALRRPFQNAMAVARHGRGMGTAWHT